MKISPPYRLAVAVFFTLAAFAGISQLLRDHRHAGRSFPMAAKEVFWTAPDTSLIGRQEHAELIRYGRELIVNTSYFLGPKGVVRTSSNGMNCQNCHLEAGTKIWGNNFGGVASLYPKFRPRSGTVESIEKKINDCFERSLNGNALDSNGREMRGMVAYMKWLGSDVKKGVKPPGSGLQRLPFLDRPADPVTGRTLYDIKCASCHGREGEGTLRGTSYLYPPLWGRNSYNNGAGILQISRFAAFIKYNMPFGVSYEKPLLTDAEAWDIAAFVNTRPRPKKDVSGDWPDLTTKPVDYPFGPFPDTFPARQHLLGPFAVIEKARVAR